MTTTEEIIEKLKQKYLKCIEEEFPASAAFIRMEIEAWQKQKK